MAGMKWYRVDGPNPFAPKPEPEKREGGDRKLVFCASIDSPKPHRCLAVHGGGVLTLLKIMPISGSPGEWQPKLREECAMRRRDGYAVYVEDRSGMFSGDATAVAFDRIEADGRTLFQHACEMMLSMQARGDLMFPDGGERFMLRAGEGGALNVKCDDKGRVRYEPDWSRVGGGHMCVLLAVCAAVLEEPWSDRWLSEFRLAPPLRAAERGWDATCRSIRTACTFAVQDALDARREAIERAKEEANAR